MTEKEEATGQAPSMAATMTECAKFWAAYDPKARIGRRARALAYRLRRRDDGGEVASKVTE